MKTPRFIISQSLDKKQIKITDKEWLNQIRSAGLRSGDSVLLVDGKKNEAVAKITKLTQGGGELEILSVIANERESLIEGILYLSILEKENFELVVQKATEIGIKEIIPVIAKRTVKSDLKMELLEKIMKKAVEQSGRGIIPTLREPVTFEKALAGAEKNDLNLFFDPDGREDIKLNASANARVGIWVGAEGGWEKTEIAAAQERNFYVLSLGKLDLRSETAAIVASYLVVSGRI